MVLWAAYVNPTLFLRTLSLSLLSTVFSGRTFRLKYSGFTRTIYTMNLEQVIQRKHYYVSQPKYVHGYTV